MAELRCAFNCWACRHGLATTDPSHTLREGDCALFFDPDQARKRPQAINTKAKVMSDVSVPPSSGFWSEAQRQNAQPVETVVGGPDEDAEPRQGPDLSCFAVAPAPEPEPEPAPLAKRRTPRPKRPPPTDSAFEDAADALKGLDALEPEAAAAKRAEVEEEEEEAPSSKESTTSSRRSSTRKGRGERVLTDFEERMRNRVWASGNPSKKCPVPGCQTKLVLVAAVSASGRAMEDPRDGAQLVKHYKKKHPELLDHLRNVVGVNVGARARECGAGSEPRVPPNHLVTPDNYKESTKARKSKKRKQSPPSNDYNRERTLQFQDYRPGATRCGTDKGARPGTN